MTRPAVVLRLSVFLFSFLLAFPADAQRKRPRRAPTKTEKPAPPPPEPVPAPPTPAAAPTDPAQAPTPAPAANPAPDGDIVETIRPSSGDAGAASPPAEGDVVETIGGNTAPAPAASSPATASSAPVTEEDENKFEVSGWARQTIEASLRTSQGAPISSAYETPYDRLTSGSQLLIKGRYSRGRWFEASVSGFLSYRVREQAFSRATGTLANVDGATIRSDFEPILRECYVGLFSKKFDFRIGQQRVAWGKADFFSPNDVVNARDTRDPFLSENETRHLPTPLLRGDLDLGAVVLQGIVSPVFIPDRFDIYGTNYSAIQPQAPAPIRGLMHVLYRAADPTMHARLGRMLEATRLPRADLTEPMLGMKAAWTAGGFDVNHYYHFGFDGPFVRLDPQFATALASTNFNQTGVSALAPLLQAIDAGAHPLGVDYVRRHHFGTDVGTTIGNFGIRVDAAYDTKKVFYRSDRLTSFVSPVFQGVLSLEYQTGDPEKLVILEGLYMRMFDSPTPVLIYATDSSAIAGTFRWPLFDPFRFEFRGIAGLHPQMLVLQPELGMKLGDLVLGLGGLWLSGERYSLGGYFENTEAYFKAKLSFK